MLFTVGVAAAGDGLVTRPAKPAHEDKDGVIFLGASEGVVRVLREILVESFSDSHAVVVSPVSIALGDRVRLWFECDKEVKELDGAVIGAALTQMNGMLRHRLTVGGQVARRPVAEIAGRFA